MALKRRRFTREFKLEILREIEAGKSIAHAAREPELHPNLITRWRNLQADYARQAFAGNGNPYKQEARIAELERLVGRLALENDFLRKALSHFEASLNHRQPPLVLIALLHLCDAAETAPRCKFGLLPTQPPAHLLLGQHLQVQANHFLGGSNNE